jgi:carbamoyltransferase
VSPFLGPEYEPEAIKQTLDNCKLSYDVLDERELVDSTVRALVKGELVGWFQGRMEWAHRALGGRSILASPLSPYVLENLNVFLKHRERHRTYGLSMPVERTAEFFAGPPVSRFMEYEYTPRDPDRFRELLPEGARSLRVQTIPEAVDAGGSPLFRRLHQRFGDATGMPILINTSFNAFREPMVCSPRDAVRVFFGSGLDRLVMGRFVLRK